MTLDKQQDCMRVCYQYWDNTNNKHLSSEQLSIITYAMLLDIVNKSDNDNMPCHIENAEKLYQNGMLNGWMKTH